MDNNNEDLSQLVLQLEQNLNFNSSRTGYKLIGVLFANKPQRKGAIWHVLTSSWEKFGKVSIDIRDDHLVTIVVASERAAHRIMEACPWSVKGFSFMVYPWLPGMTMEEVNKKTIPFWIQAKGLAVEQITSTNACFIGSQVGKVLEFEDPDEIFRSFTRVKVEVDISKPLLDGFWIPRDDGEQSWVEVKYERLSDFCFGCGRLGHDIQECKFGERNELGENQPWMAMGSCI